MLLTFVGKPLVWGQGTIIDNGASTNKWILHNPEDNRKTLFLAPWHPGTQFWDFGAQTQFQSNGNVLFSGKVSIGTSANTPASAQLDIYGNFRTTTGRFSSIYSSNTDGMYPNTYTNIIGDSQLSIGANWAAGMSDLTLINSNIGDITNGGFSFWQMTGASSKKMLAYLKADGKVGFGGIIPTRELEVRGTNPILRLGNSTPVNTQINTVIGGIEFPTSGENVFMAKINANVGAFSDQPYLTFHTGAASAEQVRITQEGNVGIGTGNPAAKLHISEGGFRHGGYGEINVDAPGIIGGRLKILDNGSVGIGNVSPPAKLSVNGEIYSKGHMFLYAFEGESQSGTAYVQARDFSGNSTLNLRLRTQQNGQIVEAMQLSSSGDVGIGVTTPLARLHVDGSFRQSSLGEFNIDAPFVFGGRLKVLENGNVGIGTTDPGAYKLAVEGKIGAREVEVKTGTWADFVFQPDYRLRPLTEVADYIADHHHLPEIPSEAEVKANGIGLGEMNTKLLQKIEELTLYSIEQQRALLAQGDELKQLKNELNQLRQQVSK
jgi:hypothetical protein